MTPALIIDIGAEAFRRPRRMIEIQLDWTYTGARRNLLTAFIKGYTLAVLLAINVIYTAPRPRLPLREGHEV